MFTKSQGCNALIIRLGDNKGNNRQGHYEEETSMASQRQLVLELEISGWPSGRLDRLWRMEPVEGSHSLNMVSLNLRFWLAWQFLQSGNIFFCLTLFQQCFGFSGNNLTQNNLSPNSASLGHPVTGLGNSVPLPHAVCLSLVGSWECTDLRVCLSAEEGVFDREVNWFLLSVS